jgi:hypothetical protein
MADLGDSGRPQSARAKRVQAARARALAAMAEQVERGELVVRQATVDELAALDRAAARRQQLNGGGDA